MANTLLQASQAQSTWQAYNRSLQVFNHFRLVYNLPAIWPAPVSHLVHFVAYLACLERAASTASSYLSGVSNFHKFHGWQDNSTHFLVRKVLEGMRRHRGRTTDTRLPITADILARITYALQFVCSSMFEARLFKAAFLLAFCGFLRVGEFTVTSARQTSGHTLQLEDVSILGLGDDEHVRLRIRHSKTSQVGQVVTLRIARASSGELCPVAAMKDYISCRPIGAGNLFIHFDRSSLSRYQFSAVLKRCLHFNSFPVDRFKSHSFRIGAATAAAMHGVPSETIARWGRWRSEAFRGYIRPDAQ